MLFNPESSDPPYGDWPVFDAPRDDANWEFFKLMLAGVALAVGIVVLAAAGSAIWVGSMIVAWPHL